MLKPEKDQSLFLSWVLLAVLFLAFSMFSPVFLLRRTLLVAFARVAVFDRSGEIPGSLAGFCHVVFLLELHGAGLLVFDIDLSLPASVPLLAAQQTI